MAHRSLTTRPGRRTIKVVGVLVAAGLAAAAAPGLASAGTVSDVQGTVHSYRHGLEPTLDSVLENRALGLPGLPGLNFQLTYGGGNSGVGVTTGAPKVYLVFWGSQWGSAGTDANGYTTLSGDAKGTAPRLQAFFKGLGTNSEGWSKVMTQYCEGVSSGTSKCPATAAHVGYPTGGALAGVWVDTSRESPSQATGDQLAQEPIKAAAHFGNTTAASNRNAEYAILSPTGTHPDGFNTTTSNWCAWHDWTGDVSVNSPYGGIAFANDPYQ